MKVAIWNSVWISFVIGSSPIPASETLERVDFNRDIRPLLSDGCFTCHGPHEKKRKGGIRANGGLRFDIRDSAFADLRGYYAIVAGKPEESELYRRITSKDEDELARRMAERGVRFVQIFHRGWDQHFNLPADLTNQCRDIDQPAAGLIQDLKQRGMLEDTLVVWGGEFGRTIYCQGKLTRTNYGRDHHPKCFTMWMAGGGVKGGVVYGETDEFSYNAIVDPVHIHDLNATILHQLGIDYHHFSFPYLGLDQRLTGVADAHVIKPILV